MDYQTQIDNLIDLAIVQRDELKQLVDQLPQLREYLSEEVEKKFEAVEPELRSELEAFFAQKTDERVDDLRGEVSERIAEVLKSLEMAASAKYAALMLEKDRAAEVLNQAEAKIAEVQAAIPGKVKELVTDELSRFPRANQIDQLRKEFAEPRGLNPRGKWQASERYQKLDLVSYNGESYVSNVDDNTEKPSRSSVAWTLSAARGQGGGGGGITSLNDLFGPPTSDLDIVGAEGSNYVRKTLTAGTNVTLTETPTEITISSTGGGGGTSAQTLIANVTNAESITITKGQVVYAFEATGNRVSVKLAYNTSDATSAKTFGIVLSDSITAGGTGTVTCVGVVSGLNLGTYSEGDSVYLAATPGNFTATKPYAPNHLVYVGIVERANNGNGLLYVRIQNGFELDEIHDVQINAPRLAGQTLLYDATTDLWKNALLTGTANQITVTNADAAVTLSIPNNPIFKGTTTVATTGGVATHVLEYAGGNSLFTGYNATNSVFAQNGGASMTLSNSVTIAAAGSNQPITLTPSGAATAGSLTLSRLTSTNQTLALLNYGTDELMSIVGTGYTGVGSRSNTGFLLYSNNTERARFLAGGNFLIAKTIDNALGRLQVNGAITMEETAGTGLFGFFGGSTLVYGSLASNPVVIRTNNTAALTLDTSQNATFAKDILLGTSGPSVPSTLSARAPRQGLVFDGTAGVYASTTIAALGTSPLTYEAVFRVPSAAGTGQGIMYVGTSASSVGGNSGAVYIQSSGELRVIFRTDNSNYSIADLSSFVTNNAGKFVHFALVRPSSGNPSVYINGVAQSPAFSVSGSPAGGWQMDLTGTNAVFNTIDGAATAGTAILSPRIYNRALSAAEVKDLYESGVPAAADINSASNTSLLTGANSDFSSAGNWVPNPPANISGGKLNLLNTHANNTAINLVAGKRYRIAFTLDSITAGNVAVYNGSAYLNITGTAGAVSYEFNVLVATTLFVRCTGGNAVVDNMFLYPIGAVLVPDAAQRGAGTTWYDTSGNTSNITLPASGVAWNVPSSSILNLVGRFQSLPTFISMSVPSLAGGDTTGGKIAWYQTGTGTVETGFLQLTQADGFGGTFTIGLNTTNSGTASTVFQIKKNGSTLLGTTTDSSNGRLQLATHTAATGGIGFGTDTALYRANAGQLYLDAPASTSGAFWVNSGAGNTSASLNLYPQGTGVAQVSAVGAVSLVLRTNNATALSLDSSQNANLAGSYFFIGGAGSNFYIRSTGSNNGLIRGNILSADFAAAFVLRNDTGTVEYVRVENPSGAVLLGTATNSSNGRLQLATHTASTGGIGFGADTALYRSAANVLRAEGTSTSTLQINGQSGFSSTLSFQRANTNRWTVECDSSDILRFKLLGTTTVLTLDASQNATLSKGLTTNGDSDTHISFVRNGTVSIGPDSTATPSLIVSTGITVSGGSFKQASFYKSTSLGSVLSGATGTSYDLYLTNPAGNYVLQVPTGTRNSEFAGTISSVGNISSAATLISSVNTDSGVLQLNLVNSSTGTSASSLLRFNAGTRTAALQAYNDTHATLAGQLRVSTSNGDIVVIPSGVTAATFGANTVSIPLATVSNSTSSGALVVSGGVGIAGNTYIGGNLVVSGTITPSGGGGGAFDDASNILATQVFG